MARLLNRKQAHIWNWLHRGDQVPVDVVPRIEEATNHQVRRWDLRPDDWHLIWPELVGAKGAPRVKKERAA